MPALLDAKMEALSEATTAANRGVDRAANIVRGVKILGATSTNGRIYSRECMEGAVAKYEGARINVNHPKSDPRSPRDYQDRFGRLQNVRVEEQGLFADVRYNPKHPITEQFLHDCEHDPANCGFSHNVAATVRKENGRTIVESIERVQSVDLVADPATTKGIFESQSTREGILADTLAAESALDRLRDLWCKAYELINASMYGEAQPADKLTAIQSVLADLNREISAVADQLTSPSSATGAEEADMNWSALTMEELQKHRPDLITRSLTEAKTGDQNQLELKRLQEELDTLKAEKALAAAQRVRAELVEKLLAEAKLPEPLVTADFRKFLTEAESDDKVRSMIEERKTLAGVTRQQKPVSVSGNAPAAMGAAPAGKPFDGSRYVGIR